jgi:hypothetical protein
MKFEIAVKIQAWMVEFTRTEGILDFLNLLRPLNQKKK